MTSEHRSRLARIRSRFTSPADVLLAVRVFGWALVLPGLKHVVPVKSLAMMMRRSPNSPKSPQSPNHQIANSPNLRDIALEQRILVFARWAARLIRWRSGGNCLERGLIAYRYLGAAGANPTLVVGLSRADRGGIIGHAWVLLDGKPAGESESAVSVYTPVFAFDAQGRLVEEVGGQRAEVGAVRNAEGRR
jgi:hypothetical protein